jgi:hypothetical protein
MKSQASAICELAVIVAMCGCCLFWGYAYWASKENLRVEYNKQLQSNATGWADRGAMDSIPGF